MVRAMGWAMGWRGGAAPAITMALRFLVLPPPLITPGWATNGFGH